MDVFVYLAFPVESQGEPTPRELFCCTQCAPRNKPGNCGGCGAYTPTEIAAESVGSLRYDSRSMLVGLTCGISEGGG